MSTTRRSIRRSARRTTRRSGLPARCTFVAAVLGGALLVPTAAFAYPDPAPAPASTSASAPASSGTSEQADGSHGQNALFLAAGGGMAAAGAAGLAYSMYRRGRSDG
ncbi:hypothetical protein EOT10_27145 [Streptomyces antnestii]|uniref:LPXTG cell wall anchor domain-containing protein n=1 Tax=Streptomyces antnestii TaxID=2494256 RepID=A0A3S2VDJ3_9ACTN|nr:hypothetical protein [Streptomyces sp. San01]RVU20362.1 hypothetical protein EOT10_27145 [Streptomyces sp. San01]